MFLGLPIWSHSNLLVADISESSLPLSKIPPPLSYPQTHLFCNSSGMSLCYYSNSGLSVTQFKRRARTSLFWCSEARRSLIGHHLQCPWIFTGKSGPHYYLITVWCLLQQTIALNKLMLCFNLQIQKTSLPEGPLLSTDSQLVRQHALEFEHYVHYSRFVSLWESIFLVLHY